MFSFYFVLFVSMILSSTLSQSDVVHVYDVALVLGEVSRVGCFLPLSNLYGLTWSLCLLKH